MSVPASTYRSVGAAVVVIPDPVVDQSETTCPLAAGGPPEGDMTRWGVPEPHGEPDVTGEPGTDELGNGIVIAAAGGATGADVRR